MINDDKWFKIVIHGSFSTFLEGSLLVFNWAQWALGPPCRRALNDPSKLGGLLGIYKWWIWKNCNLWFIHLVGDAFSPSWKMMEWVCQLGRMTSHIMENKTCSKPPTSHPFSSMIFRYKPPWLVWKSSQAMFTGGWVETLVVLLWKDLKK